MQHQFTTRSCEKGSGKEQQKLQAIDGGSIKDFPSSLSAFFYACPLPLISTHNQQTNHLPSTQPTLGNPHIMILS